MSAGCGSAPSSGPYSMGFNFSWAPDLMLYTPSSIATLWAKYRLNSFSHVRKLRLREAKNLKRLYSSQVAEMGSEFAPWASCLSKWDRMIDYGTASDSQHLHNWAPIIESLYEMAYSGRGRESQQEEQSLHPLTPDSRVSGILPSPFPSVQENPSSPHTWVSQSNHIITLLGKPVLNLLSQTDQKNVCWVPGSLQKKVSWG